MKSRLVIFGLFVILALATAFVAASRNSGRRPTGLTQSLIVTQDGRMTVAQQPGQYVTGLLIVDKPRPSTNTPSSTTNTSAK